MRGGNCRPCRLSTASEESGWLNLYHVRLCSSMFETVRLMLKPGLKVEICAQTVRQRMRKWMLSGDSQWMQAAGADVRVVLVGVAGPHLASLSHRV